jgi:hypothetical protein
MKKILLKTESEIINDFTNFFSKVQYSNKDFENIREYSLKYIKKVSKESKDDLKKELVSFDFSKKESYVGKINLSTRVTLTIAKSEVLHELSENNIDEEYRKIDFGRLERKVSPPLDAYVFEGYNKLNINPTNRGYGTLYE